MVVYLCNIAITLILGCVASVVSPRMKDKRISKFWLSFVLLSWLIIYAFRYNVGADFSGYYFYFKRIGFQQQSLVEFVGGQRDFLFAILEYLCYQIFNGNWVTFSIIIGILTYLPVLSTIRNESNNFTLASLLYIFTMNFYAGFNGIRQGIAVSFVFFAYYQFLKRKKYILYFIFIIIAFGFHSTVLVTVPFHFLSLKKVSSKLFRFTIVFMLFSYMFLWQLWAYLIEFLEMIGQDKLASDYANAMTDGSSLLRMIVYIVPAIIGIFYYDKMKRKYQNIDSEIILILLASFFMLLSTKYWLFARVALYFYMHTIVFLPKLDCAFAKNSKKIGMLLVATLYFAYMCIMLLRGDGGCLPYNFIPLEQM